MGTCPRPKDGEFPCDGRRIRQTCKDSHSLCDGGFVNTYLPCVSESACNAAMALVEPAVGYRPATCTKRGWFRSTWHLYHSRIFFHECGFQDNASKACGRITDEMDNATRTCFGEARAVTEVEAVIEAMI